MVLTVASEKNPSSPKSKGKKQWKPKILGLLCNWCSYAGADLAGTSRIQHPPNVRIIRVNCTGRIDPLFVLRGLEMGADGVLISGCHIGDCHYVEGNIAAKKRFDFFKKILDEMGLGDRITFEHVSAAEGAKWAEVIANFTNKIENLGPTPVKDVSDLTDLDVDETVSKKHKIHEVLVSIARRVDYEPEKVMIFEPEEVMEGYGFPKRDPDKCIGCYACYSVCPEHVISIEDVEDKRKYGTLHTECLVCKECEKACPQEAIEIVPGFELLSFMKEEPLWDLEIGLQKCSVCGEHFSPIPFGEDLKKRLAEKKAVKAIDGLSLPFEPYTTCPTCKREKMAQSIAEVAQPALAAGRKS